MQVGKKVHQEEDDGKENRAQSLKQYGVKMGEESFPLKSKDNKARKLFN